MNYFGEQPQLQHSTQRMLTGGQALEARPLPTGAINAVFLALCAIIGADTAATVMSRPTKRLTTLETQSLNNMIYALGILLWPPLFNLTVGYDKLQTRPRMLLGFLWPAAISGFSLAGVMQQRPPTSQENIQRQNSLNSDAQAIISAAFAMGSLMMGLKSAGGAHILMYGLLLSLAFVIPDVVITNSNMENTLIASGQSTVLNWAIGLVMAGIASDLVPHGSKKNYMHRLSM